jgi:ubiquinone/menaquinone biosynthesis C-methylase UbiE
VRLGGPGGTRAFEAEWRARFERFARTYDGEAAISGWSETGLRRRVETFGALLRSVSVPPAARVLDLGCGAGTYVRLLATLGHRVVGLDYSLPSLARAVDADRAGQGRYLAAEAYALPFEGEAFDMVVCIGLLQAVGHPERALDEMVRVLRPGGILVVEALNARTMLALAWRTRERIRGMPPRLRTYDARQLARWLTERGLHLVRRVGICLPPRRLPGLARLLALRPVQGAVEAWSGLASRVAHTFLFVAEKAGRAPGARP